MRKLMLDMDALTVESFVIDGREGDGTVVSHEDTEQVECTMYCTGAPTDSDAYSACWGGAETCGCALSNIGSCYYLVTCAQPCDPHSGWAGTYNTAGPSCESCPAVGCHNVYTAGGC